MRSLRSALEYVTICFVVMLLLNGIGNAQSALSASAAAKEYKRLLNLQTALRKIPMARQDKEPHRSFLKRNDKDIVYSEPAGVWLVRSNRFWDLEAKYHDLPIADKIAWTAADNTLPGECEGYVNCYLFVVRVTYGEYLTRFPKGAYSKRAVQNTIASLPHIADDITSAKKNYDGPTDLSERTEFVKTIQELRAIFSRTSVPEREKAISQLKVIEDGFK